MADWLDVSATDPVVSYIVGGSPQSAFTTPFIFFADTDIAVFVNNAPKTLGVDYTVSGAKNPLGGTVTFLAPQSNVTIVIERSIPVKLSTHIPPSGPLDVPGINAQFSILVAMVQEEQLRFRSLASLTSTSPTSVTIGTGSKTFTTQAGKGYAPGQPITVSSVASPANFMSGTVTAYNATSGALTVNVTAIGGAGTLADWLISTSAPAALPLPTSSTVQIVTGSGIVTAAVTDGAIVLNKTAPSVTPIQLPTIASRNGLSLVISDFAGNGGDITITPAIGERIHGLAANAPWIIGSGGAGLGGALRLLPVTGVGWVIS